MPDTGWRTMGIIEFEATPNPDALRVLPGRQLGDGPPREFVRGSAVGDPVAATLLTIAGVARVMIARDFVTVIREGPSSPWEALRTEIALALTEAEHSGAAASSNTPSPTEPLGEVEQHIEDVLDRYVRPLLAADGGEAVLVRFDAGQGIAWVRIDGACGGCPSGAATLKNGIEQAIRRWVAGVKEVRTVGEDRRREQDPKARFRRWVEAKWGTRS